MIRKKSEWTVTSYIIAGILLSAIIGISYVMVGGLATEYNTPNIVDSSFSTNYDRFQNQTDNIQAMWDATNSEDSFSLFGSAVEIFKAGVSVVRLILGGFTNLGSQISHASTDFGIPSEIFSIVSVLLITSLTVLLVLGIINFLNKSGRL